MNFWQQLKHPIFGLSPMDGITDAAFRHTLASTHKPDVIFTEFVNVDGIIKGGEKVLIPFVYSEIERPLVAQLFGINPEYFKVAARIVCELGFDGIDINMGCPSKSVAGRGAGAGLMKNPELAKEIILAAKEGVNEWVNFGNKNIDEKVLEKIIKLKNKLTSLGVKFPNDSIPVSVKTRIGYSSDEVDTWIPKLMEVNPDNISIHGRTFKQMYKGVADWSSISRGAEIIHKLSKEESPTTVLGNGDIKSVNEIQNYVNKYKVDGVLIGRATLGNPWFFSGLDNVTQKSFIEIKQKLLEHIGYYDLLFGSEGFVSQRKHMGWYVKGFPNAAAIRDKLVRSNNLEEVKKILS